MLKRVLCVSSLLALQLFAWCVSSYADEVQGACVSPPEDAASCGSQTDSRIYFGNEIPPENSPVVLVVLYSTYGGKPDGYCSGTLIASRKVLTAAHCVNEGPLAGISVIIGGNIVKYARSYIVHKSYVPLSSTSYTYAKNDLAIITLDSKVPKSVPRLKIAKKKPKSGEMISIYGYGESEFGYPEEVDFVTFPPILRGGQMTVVSMDSHNLYAFQPPGGSNTCVGDSGGPAVYQYLYRNKLRLGVIGITAYGAEDCFYGDTVFSGTFSSSARKFIRRYGR